MKLIDNNYLHNVTIFGFLKCFVCSKKKCGYLNYSLLK